MTDIRSLLAQLSQELAKHTPGENIAQAIIQADADMRAGKPMPEIPEDQVQDWLKRLGEKYGGPDARRHHSQPRPDRPKPPPVPPRPVETISRPVPAPKVLDPTSPIAEAEIVEETHGYPRRESRSIIDVWSEQAKQERSAPKVRSRRKRHR